MGFSQRAPWLYGRGNSQGDSTTGSSEVQAEVQRQLGAMMRTQSLQLEEMREELYYLRAERMRLLEAARSDERFQHQGDPRGLQYGGGEQPQPEGPPRGPKDLLVDFGVRAMRDLNVRVILENLSNQESCGWLRQLCMAFNEVQNGGRNTGMLQPQRQDGPLQVVVK